MQHLLSSQELTREQILHLLVRAEQFLPVVLNRQRLNLAQGKILATLFYEASTRTRFSFEAAMLRLGGEVISNADMEATSSAKKGETLLDTGRMVSSYADIIAMRHPQKGSVLELAKGSSVPVVNAGDGAGDHPTQGLLDLLTIRLEKGRLEHLTIGMIGDLKNGRVPHSQCVYLNHFPNLNFIFVAPQALQMPQDMVDSLKAKGHPVLQTEDLETALPQMDVICQTRIQQERFASEAEYLKYKGVYILNAEWMKRAKEDAILLHPLPRVDEIALEVDQDPRAKYFLQPVYGVAMRMAILAELLHL